MKFLSLTIPNGLLGDSVFEFSDTATIIYSAKNSVGKTTLLRFILYTLGYSIPSTRGINFSKFEPELKVLTDKNETLKICRRGDSIFLESNGLNAQFSLPFDLNDLHKIVFGINNTEVLDNLLGVYYVDQEKGWTGLNRYICIGNIHFNIEELVRGLANQSADGLAEKLTAVKREIQKYKHMLNIAEYKKEINELGENIAYDTPEEEVENELEVLYAERKPVADELKRLESVIKKNTSFKKHISNFKISVQSPTSGEIVPVNEETIVALRETEELITARRKFVVNLLTTIDKKIKTLEHKRNREQTLISFKTTLEEFDQSVLKMDIDALTVQRTISNLVSTKKALDEQITSSVKQNTALITALHNTISLYAQELGLDEKYVRANNDYIFTSILKDLSGAIFHKIVFAFRLGYIKAVFDYTGTRLPIILDSPSGREIEKERFCPPNRVNANPQG